MYINIDISSLNSLSSHRFDRPSTDLLHSCPQPLGNIHLSKYLSYPLSSFVVHSFRLSSRFVVHLTEGKGLSSSTHFCSPCSLAVLGDASWRQQLHLRLMLPTSTTSPASTQSQVHAMTFSKTLPPFYFPFPHRDDHTMLYINSSRSG